VILPVANKNTIKIETLCIFKDCVSVYLISLILISLIYLSMNNGFIILLILTILILIDYTFCSKVNHYSLQMFKIVETPLPELKNE